MEILGYVGALLMGVSLGLLGGGGSILSIPIFVYMFHIAPTEASGYSLFVVGFTSFIGFLGYLKKGLVRFKIGVSFAIPSFVGVLFVRRLVLPLIPSEIANLGGFVLTKDVLVMLVFSVIMLMASLAMIRSNKGQANSELSLKGQSIPAMQIALKGLLVGGITGFVGAGGGFLIVPSLVVLARLSMKEAVGTSLGIIAANSLIGFLGDLTAGHVIDWHFLLKFSALAAVGILVGNKLNSKVSDQKLKPIFGYFALVMGALILWQQLTK